MRKLLQVFIVVLILGVNNNSFACICDDLYGSAEKQFSSVDSNLIFTGKVINIGPPESEDHPILGKITTIGSNKYTVRIYESFKGAPDESIVAYVYCCLELEENEEYLFFVDHNIKYDYLKIYHAIKLIDAETDIKIIKEPLFVFYS